jgi:hypothetical protein
MEKFSALRKLFPFTGLPRKSKHRRQFVDPPIDGGAHHLRRVHTEGDAVAAEA